MRVPSDLLKKLFTDEITIPVGLTPVSLIKSEFGFMGEKAENEFF
jgi:hypothetical protein